MRVLYAEAVYGKEEISAFLGVLENSPHLLMSGENVKLFESIILIIFEPFIIVCVRLFVGLL